MRLTFDDETHIYRIDGVVVPSITQLLKPLIDFSGIPAYILENAKRFGHSVHKLVELQETGMLDADELDEKLIPVRASYLEWRETNGLIPADALPACEIPLGHQRLQFAGTPDLIFDGLAVVEVKTRKTNLVTDPIQTAAQDMLHVANGGTQIPDDMHFVLELYADGRHHFHRFTKTQIKEGRSRFRFLLDHYKNEKTIQSWRKK